MQKFALQVKVEQVDDQLFNSKVDLQLQNLEIELVGESILKFGTKIIDHIYNQRFKKYLDYCQIQLSIVQNVGSRRFMRASDQLGHINYSYKFLPITCIATKDVD